ncbi:MAG TPA: hypothetical protein VFI29_05915 [Hanamia sp.]|nr:hypothetical protein [Hanamia sp.]
MSNNNQAVTTHHNLPDYNTRKFTSAEIQLKTSMQGWIDKSGLV